MDGSPGDQNNIEQEERRMSILKASSHFCSSEIRDRKSILFWTLNAGSWMWCVAWASELVSERGSAAFCSQQHTQRTRYTHPHMVMARYACSDLKISIFFFLVLGDIDALLHKAGTAWPEKKVWRKKEKKTETWLDNTVHPSSKKKKKWRQWHGHSTQPTLSGVHLQMDELSHSALYNYTQ